MNKKLIISIVILLGLIYLLSRNGMSSETSSIKGVVRLGPTCPAQRKDDPACADKLYKTKLELTRFNSVEVLKTFSSNNDGEFEVSAPPGEYSIREAGGGRDSKCGKNGLIPVEAGQTTEVIVFCDTGIR